MSYLIDSKKIQNFIHNVDTSFIKESISTTIEYYPGTGVTYTPPAGSSKVIYECNLQLSWPPDGTNSYPCTRLQYSTNSTSYTNGTWTTISGTQMMEGENSTINDYDWHMCSFVFIIDSWSGERKIRLSGRAYDSSSEYQIGRSFNTIPSSGEGNGSCPHVSIYSVMS
tara:strand:+ start:15475 stop:15978 length:504 start_codon:yes stop_codon:yes gene_type:complete